MIIIKQFRHLGENHIGIGARHAVHGSCDGISHKCGEKSIDWVQMYRCRQLSVLICTSGK